MISTSNRSRSHLDLLAAAALLALLGAPVAAQDSDEDGTLPKNYDQSAPGTVTVAADDLGDEIMDPAEARLVASDLDGQTLVDLGADPADAMFVMTGQTDVVADEQGVSLQGAGSVVPQTGFSLALEAAPEALGRLTLLVLHPADADLHTLLAGGVAPVAVVAMGDLASVDLVAFQNLVGAHAEALAGLDVSLVDVSLDTQGELRVSAAAVSPLGEPIEFITN